jgi:hypothetical protein
MGIRSTGIALLAVLACACSVYDESLLATTDGGAEAGDAGPCPAGFVACGMRCVDVSKDPTNCGACDRSCKGAKCEGGTCEATLLAGALAGPRGLALDAARVYWANHASITVETCDKATGQGRGSFGGPQVQPEAMVLSGSQLYWTNDSSMRGAVYRTPSSSAPGNVQATVATDLPVPSAVAVVGSDVYFTTRSPTNVAGTCPASAYVQSLLRCPGGSCVPAACGGNGGPQALVTGLGNPVDLLAAGQELFWVDAEQGVLRACTAPSCAPSRTLASGLGEPAGLAVDAARVYFASVRDQTILSCPRAGCPTTGPTVLATKQLRPRSLVVAQGALYWTTRGTVGGRDGTVVRCSLPACDGGPVVLAKGRAGAWGLAVDEAWVYWTDEGTAGEASIDGALSRVVR